MGQGLKEKASSASYSRTGGLRCLARPSPLLLQAAEATPIHPSAWKVNSANFASTGFSEVALLGSYPAAERGGPFGKGILHLQEQRAVEEKL